MQVVVIGAGYVGCVAATCLAKAGHKVWNVEINPERLAILRGGRAPIYEPGLDEVLQEGLNMGTLVFTDDLKEGLSQADCALVAVGTPPEEDGSADLSDVFRVAQQVIEALPPRPDTPFVMATKSTVPPGTGRRVMAAIEESGRTDILYASNPEFLREGQALNDWYEGDRIVIGSEDERAGEILAQLYADLNMPIVQTDVTSAEMIKYAANAFLATKISFINEIASVCEGVGADVTVVARGAGMDKRIGTSFFQAGIGYGGSCFPKDVRALQWIASYVGYDFQLLRAVIDVNNRQRMRVLYKLRRHMGSLRNARVAVLGLSFKASTDDVRESPALEIIRNVLKEGVQVTAYDPVAADSARKLLPATVRILDDPYAATEHADAIILTTDWREFLDLDWARIRKHAAREPLIIDGRNLLEPEAMRKLGFAYEGFGRG